MCVVPAAIVSTGGGARHNGPLLGPLGGEQTPHLLGWLAQLVRATGLHPVGRRFESCTIHERWGRDGLKVSI